MHNPIGVELPELLENFEFLDDWMERYRYIKFGIVGASGTVVNLAVLHFGHGASLGTWAITRAPLWRLLRARASSWRRCSCLRA